MREINVNTNDIKTTMTTAPHIHEHLKYFMNFSVHHQKHNCLSPFDTTNIYGDFQDVSKMIFSSLSES